MKYDNISKLLKMSSVTHALNQFDFTHLEFTQGKFLKNDAQVISLQKGVLRTNCIDCLDRTNVVQTVFGRFILHKMLHRINLAQEPNGEPFESFFPVFENIFKYLWAEHGDRLSLAYSGTGALKSDFVRTGKRTKMGNLVDGYLSSKRYYLNNFVDGYNQDCHDYFIGNINPKKHQFKEHSTMNVKIVFPLTALIALAIYSFIVGVALPEHYEDNAKKMLLRFLIFVGVIYLTFKTVLGSVKKSILTTSTNE